MQTYYYDTNESVWNTWKESDMKKWLVSQGIVKSDAQIKKEKMLKLIEYVLFFLLSLRKD